MAFRLGIIILAAGGSSRFGSPKQLLRVDGETLVERAVREAAGFSSPDVSATVVVLVLGANHREITAKPEHIIKPNLLVAVNDLWQTGIASSIRCGLAALPPETDAALLTLCDLPLVDSRLYETLSEAYFRSGKGISCCRYGGSGGVPAMFGRKYFPLLQALAGDRGAKSLFGQFHDDVIAVECSQAAADIDTPEDALRFAGKGQQ